MALPAMTPVPSWFVYFAVVTAVAAFPASWLLGRLSAWARLAERYPAVTGGPGGRRIECGFLVVGRMGYRHLARLTADPTHLHVSIGVHLRPGYPTFSIPWSDITTTREVWRWSLPPAPVVRLRFARDPRVRFLIRPRVAEEVAAASDGRLAIAETRTS
jgi:hypothetical protein